MKMTRRQYAEMFGPTVGDQVRLADTEFFVQVERDLIAEGGGYGNESSLAAARSSATAWASHPSPSEPHRSILSSPTP